MVDVSLKRYESLKNGCMWILIFCYYCYMYDFWEHIESLIHRDIKMERIDIIFTDNRAVHQIVSLVKIFRMQELFLGNWSTNGAKWKAFFVFLKAWIFKLLFRSYCLHLMKKHLLERPGLALDQCRQSHNNLLALWLKPYTWNPSAFRSLGEQLVSSFYSTHNLISFDYDYLLNFDFFWVQRLLMNVEVCLMLWKRYSL